MSEVMNMATNRQSKVRIPLRAGAVVRRAAECAPYRKVRVFGLAAMLAVLSHPAGARACAACYGEPNSPASHGLTLAILALAVVVMCVLGGVVAFFVQASRKAGLVEAAAAANVLIVKS